MINLLPPKYKKELLEEEKCKLSLILGIIFLIFLICLILILFSIKAYISSQVESQKILTDLEKKQLKASEIKDFKEKIILTNQNLSKLNTFYQGQISLTEILERVSEVLPSEIYLTSFSYQKDTSKINLSGFSPTNKILFGLKHDLEDHKDFEDLTPSSQWIEYWLKKTDIEFNITLKLKTIQK